MSAQERTSDAQTADGSHDFARRRRSVRRGRERGCWVFIPATVLREAGYDPEQPPPFYRTWGWRRGSVMLRLYREQ